MLVHAHVRKVALHCLDPRVPKRHGNRNAIGFGGGCQVPLRPFLRKLEHKPQDPIHADARHDGFLNHDFAIGSTEDMSSDAGILAFGVLAHDVKVYFSPEPSNT